MAKKQKHKTVATLEQHDCRWPIGYTKNADFHFCGERSLAGRPYCEPALADGVPASEIP